VISSCCLVSQPHAHLDSVKTSYLTTTNSSLLCNESKLALHQDHLPTLQNCFEPSFALTPSQRSGPDKEITYPNVPLAHSFINILHNAELPNDILLAFNATSYFLALHKK
jgi:hypothetical protein